MSGDAVTYCDRFRVKYISKEIQNFMTSNFLKLQTLGYKNITANIYRIQASDSIKYGYYVLDDFMIKGQSLLEYTNLFFPKEYGKKNYKIILNNFQ